MGIFCNGGKLYFWIGQRGMKGLQPDVASSIRAMLQNRIYNNIILFSGIRDAEDCATTSTLLQDAAVFSRGLFQNNPLLTRSHPTHKQYK